MSNLVLQELAKEGQTIRKAYQRRLPSDTSKDYYFMQRNTGITEPITVEYGFLDTASDAEKLKNNYLKYAEATVRAVLNYIGYIEGTDNTYTVKKGDSLYKIANEYNTTVDELMKLNNLSSNLLSIGQKILIPKQNESQDFDYIVKLGDTLYSIANKYNTTVNEIKSLNNLNSNLLTIGQTLKLPKIKNNTYIVKSGDNLYSIANKYNTTVDELKKKNNLSSNLLTIGQVLIV